MLATCICLNGSLLDQLSCTIVYLHNLFTCTFGRINMSVCLSVSQEVSSIYPDILMALPWKPWQCFTSVPLDFCLPNTCSGSNKWDDMVQFFTDNDLDILARTERLLKPDNAAARGDMTPAG